VKAYFQDVPPEETVDARIIWFPKQGIETSLVDVLPHHWVLPETFLLWRIPS